MKFILVAIVFFMATEAFADCGNASWYNLNSRTASGEKMNGKKRLAAHKSLPFNTKLKITNMKNGKSTIASVLDRGPFIRGRILDLSLAAARDIDMIKMGTARVCYEIIRDREK
jgi:rare lipoprotein A